MEQLQTIEKEMRALDAAHKELGDLRDTLDRKKGERSELIMRREVGFSYMQHRLCPLC